MTATRTERDDFASLELPSDALWAVQTARSLHFFAIGTQRMPTEILHALAQIKAGATTVNAHLGLPDAAKARAIEAAATRISSAGCCRPCTRCTRCSWTRRWRSMTWPRWGAPIY